jgi:hypothetical protein
MPTLARPRCTLTTPIANLLEKLPARQDHKFGGGIGCIVGKPLLRSGVDLGICLHAIFFHDSESELSDARGIRSLHPTFLA